MLELEELTEALAGFVDSPVLVVGDLMIDEYVWGRVNRISPEAPVQIVEAAKEESTLGGAGNVVKNLISLDAKVHVCSAVDGGESGSFILGELRRLGADCSGVFREPFRISSRKTRILSIDTNQQILRIDRESVHPIPPEIENKILAYVESRVDRFRSVILSDYLKGVLTKTLAGGVIACARRKNVPVIVDPKGRDYTKYRNATVITPNRREAESLLDTRIGDEESLLKAGRSLLAKVRTDSILITLGKEGMAFFQKGKKTVRIPAVKKEVFDVTGAGDTVVSLLGLGYASGLDPAKSVEIANAAAGIVVGKIGTATATRREIVDDFMHHRAPKSDKVVELPRLVRLVQQYKNGGKTVVFTNGCFDILHVGHTSFLSRARRLGDVLIVGLNSDDSVRRLKGPHRPIVPMKERAAILSSLAGVDYICIFDEDTPIRLIEAVRPDILVKGDDYRREEVVGHDFVESYGGRVSLIPLVRGVSTTSIIEKIARSSGLKRESRT